MNENQAKVSLGGREIVVEASLAACLAYSNEFAGKLEEPYKGRLMDDLLALYNAMEGKDAVEGLGAIGDSGLFRIVWAMGRACGSVKEGYQKFERSMEHAPMNMYEYVDAYRTVVGDLAGRTFFRLPEGQGDAVEPDAEESAQG